LDFKGAPTRRRLLISDVMKRQQCLEFLEYRFDFIIGEGADIFVMKHLGKNNKFGLLAI
jgi:hypothetical protein